MEIETNKPTPEQQELQSLFQQTDVESIVLLVKENEELLAKLKVWEACADKLIHFANIVREVEGNATRNPHYYNSACEAIEQYEKLKLLI